MQNIAKYSKNRYSIPRHLISSFNSNESIKLCRIPTFKEYCVLQGMQKKCGIFQPILQNYFIHQRYLLEFRNYRNFSTSSINNNQKKDSRDKRSQKNDDDDDHDDKESTYSWNMLIVGSIAYIIYFLLSPPSEESIPLTWKEFVHELLLKGEVQKIVVQDMSNYVKVYVHDGAIIKGRLSFQPFFTLYLPHPNQLEDRLRLVEQRYNIKIGDEISVIYSNEEYSLPLLRLFLGLSIAAFCYMMLKTMPMMINNPFKMRNAKFILVDPAMKHGKGIRFEDVAGLKEAKVEVMEFVDYLKQPDQYKVLGAKIPKGALLLGPPGCGKTLLAKALATEANVPFLSMNGSEFIEIIGGVGPARVRDLFKEAKKRAPSIIYIDEIDAIGTKRLDVVDGGGELERTLNQLLVEMDGMTSRDDIIVLASTNREDVLDKALLRPGRFDRHILIDLPTLQERKEIFEYHLTKIALQQEPSKYSGYLSYLTPGFSGADIANVCNEAALHAARHQKKIVESSDLMYAVDRVIGGITKKNHTVTQPMKRVIAYHEAGHALVGWLLKHTDALLKVTIVPRTNSNLGFSHYVENDQKLQSKEQLQDKMCMMLAGRAAEGLIFNQITTGAQNDLEKVTKLAYLQVQQYGMCPTVGLLAFDKQSTSTSTKKPYSKKMGNLMDVEARRLIAEAYENAQKIISDNRDKLEKLAEALLEKETLSYTDVEKLIGPPPYEKKRLLEPSEFESSVTAMELTTVDSAMT